MDIRTNKATIPYSQWWTVLLPIRIPPYSDGWTWEKRADMVDGRHAGVKQEEELTDEEEEDDDQLEA